MNQEGTRTVPEDALNPTEETLENDVDAAESNASPKTPEELQSEIDSLMDLLMLGNSDGSPVDLKAAAESLESLKSDYFVADKEIWDSATRNTIRDMLIQLQNQVEKMQQASVAASREDQPKRSIEQQEVLDSLHRIFSQARIPEREPGQNFNEYLQIFAKKIWELAAKAQLNAIHDSKDTPRTSDYTKQPMVGPVGVLSLNGAVLTHDVKEESRIKTFDALLDYFGAYFDDPEEQAAAEKMAQDMKERFKEMSIWHERARIRRANEDPAGPGGALKAYETIYNTPALAPNIRAIYTEREGATEFEKRHVDAMQFAAAVWSAMSLKLKERQRLWDQMDPAVKAYFNPDTQQILGKYDVLPRYRSSDTKRLNMIRKMLLDIEEKLRDPQEPPLADPEKLTTEQAIAAARESLSRNKYDDARERKRPTYVIAEGIYAQAENLRIGSGIEAFYDANYKTDDNDKILQRDPKIGNVTVQAQEGEPKAANLGLYVESAWSNESRPDFIVPFKDYLVHGYPPYLRASQFTVRGLNNGSPLNYWGDSRASLAEIFSVDGALEDVDWSTGSSNPDKVVANAANQAVNFLYPQSSISKAVKPENSFHVDVLSPPLTPTFMLNKEDELYRARTMLGWYNPGKRRNIVQRGSDKIRGDHTLEQLEQDGFSAEAAPLTNTARIKVMYKDSRDYWLDAFQGGKDTELDGVRNLAFMFARDDTESGYVNPKITKRLKMLREKALEYAKELKRLSDDELDDLLKESGSSISEEQMEILREKADVQARIKLARMDDALTIDDKLNIDGKWYGNWVKAWMQGYITYDLLMRSTFYMLSPDTRGIPKLAVRDGVKPDIPRLYHDLSEQNYEDVTIQTRAGSAIADGKLRPPLNIRQLEWLIYESILLQDVIPADNKLEGTSEKQRIIKSGYQLYDGSDGSSPSLSGVIFNHADLLDLARHFNMGEGYRVMMETLKDGKQYYRLRKDPKKPLSLQDLSNRLTLALYLFNERKLAYT